MAKDKGIHYYWYHHNGIRATHDSIDWCENSDIEVVVTHDQIMEALDNVEKQILDYAAKETS